MKKKWIIIAASLILAGMIIFTGVMTMLNWDFSKLTTSKYQTATHTVAKDFNNISIKTSTAEIKFLPATDGKTTVVCYEQKSAMHSVELVNDTLVIEEIDERKWYHYLSIGFSNPTITVYLPKSEYTELSVNASTGDMNIPANFSFESVDISKSTGDIVVSANVTGLARIITTTGDITLKSTTVGEAVLSVSTGDISVENVMSMGDITTNVSTGDVRISESQCLNLISDGNTGDLEIYNVIAVENFKLTRSTGDVEFKGCDAANLFIETSTGSVKGSLLSEKIFFAESNTGRINVPKTVNGGRCEIKTDTGNIKVTIE